MAVSPESITALVPSNTALATSDTSARVGVGRGDHRLEHLGGRDHRLAVGHARADDLLLDVGHVLEREAHAEVAAGDHHAVGHVEDVVEVGDGRAGLDLGDDHRAVGPDGQPHGGDVLGGLHERHGHRVDAGRAGRPRAGAGRPRSASAARSRSSGSDTPGRPRTTPPLDHRRPRTPSPAAVGDHQRHAAVAERDPVAGHAARRPRPPAPPPRPRAVLGRPGRPR